MKYRGDRAARPALWGALVTALAYGYLTALFFLQELGWVLWFVTTGVVGAVGYAGLRVAISRDWTGLPWAQSALLLAASLLFSFLLIDIAFSLFLNATAPTGPPDSARMFDRNTLPGELYPHLYYPTEENFRVHKPNVRVSGTHFGNFYHRSMLDSPTLVERVLEPNHITIAINELGFRESSTLGEATIFTLGDSFAFGWGVNEALAWPGLLETQTGRVVYNLSIHDASPKQELELLKFVLRYYGEARGIKQLLWMIYEGNDLEDSFAETRPEPISPGARGRARGTVIQLITRLPRTLREQSVIWKLRTGQVTFRLPAPPEAYDPYTVDGVSLAHPLYHSESLGSRLFFQPYVELVQQPQSYVRNHPNRARLDQAFAEMAELARDFDFEVIVILAPTAARLHGPYFAHFPTLSAKPHFLDYVNALSRSLGFEVINLATLLEPYAESELLFFRDDDHFNSRGHTLVAEIIKREVFMP